jgi:hypothetical protein
MKEILLRSDIPLPQFACDKDSITYISGWHSFAIKAALLQD